MNLPNEATIGVVLIVAHVALATLATRFVVRRGFTGLRRGLLLIAAWFIPFIGTFCAFMAAWEYGQPSGFADTTMDIWLAGDRSNGPGAGCGHGGGDSHRHD